MSSDALLARLHTLHPMLIDLSLGRTERLLAALDNPHLKLPPVLHVAGTNGKGSTVAHLRAMLEAGGKRVQTYISPHLVREYQDIAVVERGNPFLPATRGWITKDRSEPGHIGCPHLASPEKGETLFATFSDGVQQLLNRIIQWDGKSWEG
mgnify:CR=1 FL=1